MKRLAVTLGLLGIAAALWLWSEPSKPKSLVSLVAAPGASALSSQAGGERGAEQIVPSAEPITTRSLLIGETILHDYAAASRPPRDDLDSMAQLMDNFLLLVKSAANRPLSANEDWAAALRGRNPAQERFLPDQHAAFNTQGQLVDRWGSPLFFHALGRGGFEIRSAGPDRQLWTADDIHRNSDGSFRGGAELNSSSLVDAAMK